jgi:hypothetical protein
MRPREYPRVEFIFCDILMKFLSIINADIDHEEDQRNMRECMQDEWKRGYVRESYHEEHQRNIRELMQVEWRKNRMEYLVDSAGWSYIIFFRCAYNRL